MCVHVMCTDAHRTHVTIAIQPKRSLQTNKQTHTSNMKYRAQDKTRTHTRLFQNRISLLRVNRLND